MCARPSTGTTSRAPIVLVQAYRKARGATAELAAAISWEARGALAVKDLDRAAAYADQTRQMTLPKLRGPRVDREQWLYAIGASIEVQAQVMAARGESGDAVLFLQKELKTYTGTSQQERIQKNINLLSLEGKPAPALEAAVWFGPKPPSIASLRGKAILLFFWAHWCPDCKADVPIIAGLMKKYGPARASADRPDPLLRLRGEWRRCASRGRKAVHRADPPPVLCAAGRYARASKQCEFRPVWREFHADAGSGGSPWDRALVSSRRGHRAGTVRAD